MQISCMLSGVSLYVTLFHLHSVPFTFHLICVLLVYSLAVYTADSTKRHRSGPECVLPSCQWKITSVFTVFSEAFVCSLQWCSRIWLEEAEAVAFKQSLEFGGEKEKGKGRFSESIPIRHVYDVIFLSTQMLKGCIQNACFMPISNLFAPFVTIQLSVQQMKRITQINNRLWLASISLQVNRAVYKHSHQNLIHFFLCNFAPVLVLLSAFLNNVHSVCPCSNSFVVVD